MAHLTASGEEATRCIQHLLCNTGSRGVNLPKLALLTFCGDPMKWAAFWERFEEAVDSNDKLSAAHKLTYLREAVKDPKVSPLLPAAPLTIRTWLSY